MTQRSDIPFNVTLLDLTPAKLQGLRPVTALDIFDGSSNNFHPDGLFSTLIFGKEGDERRMSRFSFIDIKIPIFHPVIYRALITLKRIYAGILSGNEYVIWNPEIKDFERSDAVHGKTGFQYFVDHWKEIEFDRTNSTMRQQNILMIEKYKNKSMTSKVIVMPAGYRDIEIGSDGRIREDEINTYYRQILAISNTISMSAVESNPEIINTARHGLQNKFNELYDMIESMVKGKKKLLLGKWASRRIMNGTRNVITSMDTSVPYLGAKGSPGFNNTIIGLYQMLKAIMPVARYHIRNGFLSKAFTDVNSPATLVNKETLKAETVTLRPEYFDRFMTDEGIEKVITAFADGTIRHKPIEIEGHYLGLIYKGPDNTFKLLQDIDELPETRNPGDVYPLTFCELLYCSIYSAVQKTGFPLFFTRYPITGIGSIYPSIAYIKTTIKSETRQELDEGWEPMDDDHIAHEFPITDGEFVNSLVPHSSKLAGAGADFDGDTGSGNVTYSDEAIAEVREYLTKKRAYVGTDGNFVSSTNVFTISLVLHNLTS